MTGFPLALVAVLASATSQGRDVVPLYTDLGNYHRDISANSPKAQRYFDQGLRLLYAFNHGEAIRAFKEALRLSPDCTMCAWGVAYAYGPHVNGGMDSAAGVQAFSFVKRGLAKTQNATPVERELIGSLARRYAEVPPANRGHLDSNYADAMKAVARRYPNDLDVATLYAESMMDLRPWDYWDLTDGSPRPGTEFILAELERVIAANPNHPGACHYYIHAVEAVAPEKAVPCAERLAALMPGAGHLVHMPAHIYVRVGRYADAVDANVHAVHTDEVYIEGQNPGGLYRTGYYPHNYHFLALAATMAGRSAQAIEAANKTAATTPISMAKRVSQLEPYVHYRYLTLVTFGRWDDLLAAPVPPVELAYSRAMAQYARGVALAAKGRFADAQAALDTVKQIASGGVAAYAAAGWGTPSTNLQIAVHALTAEIAARQGDFNTAITHFQAAQKIEDAQLYTEPPDWYYPIRHSLGAVLLKAGKPAEAEVVYREDLKRFPENGWSLFGLAQALHAQNKHTEAVDVEARFQKAWATADVKLTASRF